MSPVGGPEGDADCKKDGDRVARGQGKRSGRLRRQGGSATADGSSASPTQEVCRAEAVGRLRRARRCGCAFKVCRVRGTFHRPEMPPRTRVNLSRSRAATFAAIQWDCADGVPLISPLDSIHHAGEASAVSIVPSDEKVPRTRHSSGVGEADSPNSSPPISTPAGGAARSSA